MRHLFSSAFQVQRLSYNVVNGRPVMAWNVATSTDYIEASLLAYFIGRLDLTFLRPGKDVLPAPEQGKAPDRIGILFCASGTPIKAGDRIVAIPNAAGVIVTPGTFEVRNVPDTAMNFSGNHHIEVQVQEVNTAVSSADWPVDGTSAS